MKARVRQKTFARISNDLREKSSITTDKGNLIFRIDSESSIPKGPEDKKGEPETFQWISESLKPGHVFLDIGANIGVFSLYAALFEGVKVIAIEPSSESFATLNANIRLNGLDKKIETYCVGASNKTKLTKLFMKDSSSGSSHNSVEKLENQFGSFKANDQQAIIAIRLDDFIGFEGSLKPDHIKIDVDGNEPEIIEGGTEVLKRIKSLLIEIEGKNLSNNFKKINSTLKEAGLTEDKAWRDKGSGRNRLFVRN